VLDGLNDEGVGPAVEDPGLIGEGGEEAAGLLRADLLEEVLVQSEEDERLLKRIAGELLRPLLEALYESVVGLRVPVDEGLGQIVLRREVVEEGAAADVGGLLDVVDRRRGRVRR